MKLEPHEIIDLPGTPAAIHEAGNVPWHYMGKIRPGTPSLVALCKTCFGRNWRGGVYEPATLDTTVYAPEVALHRYPLIVDGRRVGVWWGRCPACAHVTYGMEFGP